VILAAADATVAIVVAVVSLALSTVGFLWQVVTWRLGRPVVKVQAGTYAVAGLPPHARAISIRTQNIGGMPVTITAVGFQRRRRRDKSGAWIILPHEAGHVPPHRLEPGDEAVFFVTVDAMREQLASGGVRAVHPWVALATGKVKIGRRASIADAMGRSDS
jgi:hypothetical protein